MQEIVELKRNKSDIVIRKIVLVATIVFLLFVVCGMNISNIACYKDYLPNNTAEVSTITVGEAKHIRSDEFGCWTTAALYKYANIDKGDKALSELITSYISPTDWGMLFLPKDMAYAWFSTVFYYMLFLSSLFLFRIIAPNNWKFSLAAAIIVTFAPGFAWWNLQGIYTCALIFSCVDLFYYFFEVKKIWARVLMCMGLVVCMSSLVLFNPYPAWAIPLAYMAVFVLVAIYLGQKRIPIEKRDWIFILTTIAIFAGVMICYYISARESLELIGHTEYPGKRFCVGGDLSYNYFGHYLMALELPYKSTTTYLNISELATFLTFFPLPWLVFVLYYKEIRERKVIASLLLFNMICLIYEYIGFSEALAKYSLLSRTIGGRLNYVADFALMLALLLEIWYIKPFNNNERIKERMLSKKLWLINVIMILFLMSVYHHAPEIVEYMTLPCFLLMSVGVLVFTNIVCLRARKFAILAMLALTIMAGVTVNPINTDLGIMDDTPLAKKVVELDAEDEGNWITNGDPYIMSKYLRAQGVECLNSLSYPPRMDLFKPIDETGEYYPIYNRYAHVYLNLTHEKSSFEMRQLDAINLYLNYSYLEPWKVKYIVSREDISGEYGNITIAKIYDDLDDWDIYKVLGEE